MTSCAHSKDSHFTRSFYPIKEQYTPIQIPSPTRRDKDYPIEPRLAQLSILYERIFNPNPRFVLEAIGRAIVNNRKSLLDTEAARE
jgi:hypothetical protein